MKDMVSIRKTRSLMPAGGFATDTGPGLAGTSEDFSDDCLRGGKLLV